MPQNELAIEILSKPKQTKLTNGLKGFRLESKDKCNVVRFNKNNFAFSRLRPYYAINITETIQKSLPYEDISLIFDIDVYTRLEDYYKGEVCKNFKKFV